MSKNILNDDSFQLLVTAGSVRAVRVTALPGKAWCVEAQLGLEWHVLHMKRKNAVREFANLSRLAAWLAERGVRSFEVDTRQLDGHN
jgi:hypothetical protein